LALVDATAGTDRLIRGADGHVAAFSHDGRWIAVSVGETAVDVVAVDTLTSVRGITSAGVSAVALSPDGRVVVIASSTGTASNTIEAWEVDTGERIGRAAADGVVSFLSYSGDGQHLAVATRETEASARVAIWDAARLTPRMALGALDGTIRSAAFSPDGTHLIALDDRQGLFDWDVATGRLLVVSETPVVEEVGSTGMGWTTLGTSAIGLSPDGSEVVSIGYAVRTWATSALLTTAVETRACQLAGRNLTAAEWERYLPTEPRSMTCPDLPPG
jgi:WD40 repeat protein